jgi:hypothetical protein
MPVQKQIYQQVSFVQFIKFASRLHLYIEIYIVLSLTSASEKYSELVMDA